MHHPVEGVLHETMASEDQRSDAVASNTSPISPTGPFASEIPFVLFVLDIVTSD
jgi:hypothetical protein